MKPISAPWQPAFIADSYWLTRFVLLRWMGFVYLVAFYVAAEQLVPLVGSNGLTPVALFYPKLLNYCGDPLGVFLTLPSLFWFDNSDTMLRVVPWIGVALAACVLAGYANAIMMTVLWLFYVSIVSVGQIGTATVGKSKCRRPASSASFSARCWRCDLSRAARRRGRLSFFFAG